MRHQFWIITITATVLFIITLVGIFWLFRPLREYQTLHIGDTTIRAEVVRGNPAKARGLGGRNTLGDNESMLFIFDQPGLYSFWMKGMRFPLDMIWIDEDYKIIHIERNVSPDTYPQAFVSKTPARYILEVNAGFTRKNAITVGDSIAN